MPSLVLAAPATVWTLGTRVSLGDHPHAKAVMGAGWAQPEGDHVWNDGPECHMHIAVAATQRALTLSVTGIPLIHQRCPFQEITLFVNGYRLAFWRLSKADISQLSATIAPEQIVRRGEHGALQISWHIPFSVSPSELGAGSDARELGFCFHTLSLS